MQQKALVLLLSAVYVSLIVTAAEGESLAQAINGGKVEVTAKGLGGSTGDSILLTIKRIVPELLRLTLTSGTVFESVSSGVQNMVAARLKGERIDNDTYTPTNEIILDSDASKDYIVEAYCMDFNKDNPSPSTEFKIKEADGYLASLIQTGLADGLNMNAIQSAIWIQRDNATDAQLTERFPVNSSELSKAHSLVETVAQTEVPDGEKKTTLGDLLDEAIAANGLGRKKTLDELTVEARTVGLQRRLASLGYDPGPADGLWGPRTKRAVRQFQIDNGLPPTGRLDEETVKASFKPDVPAARRSLAERRSRAAERQQRAAADVEIDRQPLYELTTVDITKLDDFHSSKASVLGFRLGMSRGEIEYRLVQPGMASFRSHEDSRLVKDKNNEYIKIGNNEYLAQKYVLLERGAETILEMGINPANVVESITIFHCCPK